ncbi:MULTISPECIES: flotillin family protein [Sphingobacterium]|uniref:flotillin family protein n=1 Tax=Sphingobacterium TaxID=28453 RepID=UPI000C0BC093|nr:MULTISPECIES: flotillin [Sphingobacterium]MCT1531543.1 flotillin family protein [Sphingobacterium daejeonense]VTP96318.1 Inner membrane protein yqiK [Sphingobacterium daejeonense]
MSKTLLFVDGITGVVLIAIGAIVFIIFAFFVILSMFYKKIPQGKAIVRSGVGGTKVAFNKGMYVIPVFHKMEIMDISVKKIEINRMQGDGLICKDNIRADIKVAFFVRVNKSVDDVINVAQNLGCDRASDPETLKSIFEAKFSEALKTVGKKFDFTELYEARREFRDEILNIIGTDLNGYILDDCAIDYLEQTELKFLSTENILDSEGIKKITELTARQNMNANLIRREEEKVIKKQDVEAREAILELERQLAEKEEKQRREVDNIKAREEAEIVKVREEERLKSETVRISTEEALAIQEENKLRQIIIAEKSKLRTDAVETERVEKDRALEATERERIVALAQIDKQRSIETEQKSIQGVIKERVQLEKGVIEEQQAVKDIEVFRDVERKKQAGVIAASQEAEERLIATVKAAEAAKIAAEQEAEKKVIDAEAARKIAEKKAQELLIDAEAKKEASSKEAEARKIIAEAQAKEEAAIGLSEAEVMVAKAEAQEIQGTKEASVIEKKAEALRKEGLAEAEVVREKALAEAKGIEEKAAAMKQLDSVGKEHEEFKLHLQKERDIDLAQINIQKDIANAQSAVLAEALKSAKIDIVGGETMFFENIVRQVSNAKGFDHLINNSTHATDIKNSLIGEDGNGDLGEKIKSLADKYGVSSNDIKNLTISAALVKLQNAATAKEDVEDSNFINSLFGMAKNLGISNKKINL